MRKIRRINYKGTKIILTKVKFNFKYYAIRYNGKYCIVFGRACNNKGSTIHNLLKIIRN